jgi:predicted permease
MLNDLRLRLRSLFHHTAVESDLNDELRFHFDQHVEKLIASGVPPVEARRRTRLELGTNDKIREDYRDASGIRFLETLAQDIRFALRMLRKSPGFTAVAFLTLALGIGANTAVFSLIDAFMLRSLPIPDPSRVVQITSIDRAENGPSISIPAVQEIEQHQQVFSSMGAYSGEGLADVEINGELGIADVDFATGTYYSVLGTKPLLGRLLTPDDVGLNGGAPSNAVVISYDYWQRHFGGATDVVGKTIRIEKFPFTIIGVTPRNFFGLSRSMTTIALTVPLTAEREIFAYDHPDNSKPVRAEYIVARLRDGVGIEKAEADLKSLWPGILADTVPANLKPQDRADYLSSQLQVTPPGQHEMIANRFSKPLYVLMALAGLILLVACANLATLMLARAAARNHELSIRVALGASRWRLAQQLLVESILLAVVSALLGLAFGYYGASAIISLIVGQIFIIPTAFNVAPNFLVLAFTTLAAILTGVLFGLAPAWSATRSDPNAALQQSARTTAAAAGKFGKALICAQVALSVILLMGAGLFVRSLGRLNSLNPGFTKKNILTVQLENVPGGYDNINNDAYYPDLVRRISALPGVLSASTSLIHVGGGYEWTEAVSKIGSDENGSFAADFAEVSPGFFKTLKMNILEGRDFAWQDTEHAPAVAIVSRTLAQKLSPSGDVVGLHIRIGSIGRNDVGGGNRADVRILGVVSDARIYDVHSANLGAVYIPGLQGYAQWNDLEVRAAGNPQTLVPFIRQTILSMGHEYARTVKTLTEADERTVIQDQVTAMLSGFFGALALLIAAIGLFGLMAYNVTRRTRELGIRFALGAQRGSVLRMILRETLTLALIGVAIGLPCALAATRLIAHMLFGVTPYDPLTLAAVPLALLSVAALAGYIPARRAMKVDPMVALRYE